MLLLTAAIGTLILKMADNQALRIVKNGLSTEVVKETYHTLRIHVGQADVPPLIIMTSGNINAWTDGETVVITTALLNEMRNVDELATVLAHEIAHAINHDPGNDTFDQRDQEAHADKLGAFIMMRAGFDICKGKETVSICRKVEIL